MLKVYGADLSSPALKVRYVANALGIPHEYQRVNIMGGENRSEAFLKLHPAAKIPVIDDDGFALFESNAIIRYLADKNGSKFYPKDVKKRAIVDQWIDFASFHVGMALNKVFYNRVIVHRIGGEVDEISLKDGLKFLDRFLPIVNDQLNKGKYLTGNELTLADFDLLAILDPSEASGVDLKPYAALTKWRDELRKQDFYQKVHKVYGESLMAKK